MKRFRSYRTWILVVIVSLIIGTAAYANYTGKYVDVNERFSEFIEDSDYDKKDISEDKYKHTEEIVSVDINDEIHIYTEDEGRNLRAIKDIGIESNMEAPANEKYTDNLVRFMEYVTQDVDSTKFEFEDMISDIIEQGEGSKEVYFNEDVNISIEYFDDGLNVDGKSLNVWVFQNLPKHGYTSTWVKEMKEDEGISKKLEP